MRSPIPRRRAPIDAQMAQHEGLVHAVVRRQWGGALSYEERLHAGRIGLWQALAHYDPDRGAAFSTYAWSAITHQVWRAVRLAEREGASAAPSAIASPEPDEGLLRDELCYALHTLVDRLPAMWRPVVVAYYGLADEPSRSFRQIGRQMGLSHEAVRLHLWAALVWLRHPAHCLTLRQLLDRNSSAEYEHADRLAQAWLRKRGGRRVR